MVGYRGRVRGGTFRFVANSIVCSWPDTSPADTTSRPDAEAAATGCCAVNLRADDAS